MDIAPDVMKRFLSAFGAGSNAAESSARTGIASRGQALDFVQKQQQMAMQERAQEAEIAQGNMKLAFQREAQSAQNSLAAQKIQQDTEQAAMQFKMQQQKMDLDRIAFVENLKAQKAISEKNLLEFQARREQVEKDNEFRKEKLELDKAQASKKNDFQMAIEERKRQTEENKTTARNQDIYRKNYDTFIKIISNPMQGQSLLKDKPENMTNEEFATTLAQQATQKAIGGGGKVDPSTYTPPVVEEEKVDTTGNSQQGKIGEGLGVIDKFVIGAALEQKVAKLKPGETITVNGKTYRKK